MTRQLLASYRRAPARNKGFVLMIMTLGLMFFVSTVGLGVDAGVSYVVRARLQAAADGSALAAARSLNTALDLPTQQSTAISTGNAFFKTNFPPGMFNTTSSNTQMQFAYGTTPQTLSTFFITSNATASAPTYFMRVFGKTNVPVSAKAIATRRDMNLMMVLDVSGSMDTTQAGTTDTACTIMKNSAKSFVDMFSNGRDTIGLVTFSTGSKLAFAPATNFSSGVKTSIDAIDCDGGTNTVAGLKLAYDQLVAINQPSKLNVIILFTDGLANGMIADFPIRMQNDTRYGDGTNNSLYPSTSTLYNMPPSACQDASGKVFGQAGWNPFKIGDPGAGATNNTMRGTLFPNGSNTGGTGASSGPFEWYNTNGTAVAPSQTGCGYMSNSSRVRRDIAYVPATDIWGNSTSGYRTNWDYATSTTIAGVDKFGAGHPYVNQIRPDSPRALWNVGANLVDNLGTTIRANTTINPMISTIGLGGNTGQPADAEALIRLANLPMGYGPSNNAIDNPSYNALRPQGSYAYAPNSSQLAAAFTKVASFVSELAY